MELDDAPDVQLYMYYSRTVHRIISLKTGTSFYCAKHNLLLDLQHYIYAYTSNNDRQTIAVSGHVSIG